MRRLSARKRAAPKLGVGVDVGGTWIRVLALAGGHPVARATARARDVPEVSTFLRSLWRRRRWTAQDVRALVVASRGIWTTPERHALAWRMRSLARRVIVYSDAQVALLGALGERPGLLILSGTGSIVIGYEALESSTRIETSQSDASNRAESLRPEASLAKSPS